MKTIDYNTLSKTYDLTRDKNINTLKIIISKGKINKDSYVLDFGCGTGNYAIALKRITGANVFGVDPSEGMLEKAIEKNTNGTIKFKTGDHKAIPSKDNFFDLIYMTDVIHHVPDINAMFQEFSRTLKKRAKVCIVTESYRQIETRFWSDYFPATVTAEKKRYHDITDIIAAAKKHGLKLETQMNTDREQVFTISLDIFTLIEKQGYSMFKLISDEEFKAGLERLTEDYKNQVEIRSDHGETFLWFEK
ncbi:MAG: methyltransferase domain-containing protein [Oscillospiraceae bacterium]|nr:methyltransferase domain-containing protein [Oscillospiraceae bacterium]